MVVGARAARRSVIVWHARAGAAGEPGVGRRGRRARRGDRPRAARAARRSPTTTRRRTPTGWPTRSARCASSRTPTGRMNEPLGDEREVLCVSQFTLYGDARKGNRPAYVAAARPEHAEPLYERFCERLGRAARRVRRAHGRRAGQRRAGDAAARSAVGCGADAARGTLRLPLRRRAAAGPAALRPLGRHAAGRVPRRLPAGSTPRASELGEAGAIDLVPRPHVGGPHLRPVTARTTTGLDLFGYVSFTPGDDERRARRLLRRGPTSPTRPPTATPSGRWTSARRSIGGWRGENGEVAAMTLVWGVPARARRRDRHRRARRPHRRPVPVAEDRFTLIAPGRLPRRLPRDRALGRAGGELARESLYEDDGEDERRRVAVAVPLRYA